MRPETEKCFRDFANRNIGAPFLNRGRSPAGWDCWGVIIAAYRECLGYELPDRPDLSAEEEDAGQVFQAFMDGFASWQEVPAGQGKIGDIIIFRPNHAGLVLGAGRMLHCREQVDTVVERYDNYLWSRLVIGIFRHAELSTR